MVYFSDTNMDNSSPFFLQVEATDLCTTIYSTQFTVVRMQSNPHLEI